MAEYLTVVQAAKLLGVSERAIQKNAMNGKYGQLKYISGARGGACGKVLQIPLTALPGEAQARYIETKQQLTEDEVRANAYDSAPEWQRERADFRHSVIRQYQAYIAQHPQGVRRPSKRFSASDSDKAKSARVAQEGNKTKLTERFVKYWNEMHLKERISRATLYNWLKAFKDDGIAGLLTDYGQRREQRSISKEAWISFCEKYLQLSCLSVEFCYDLVALEAREYGWTLPTVQTVARMAKQDIPEGVKMLRRYGFKKYYDNIQAFTRRDPESISAGEVFVGDHHVFDFFILSGKKWVRPWLTAWLDMRSRKLVGWNINLTPRTDTIIAAFAEAALDQAIGLPKDIYIDNGRDYCSYKFAGRGNRGKQNLTDDEKIALIEEGKRTATLMERLQVEPHFAIVENARAKVIEREFKNVVERFSKLMPTYCGRNKNERPEDLGGKLKKETEYGVTLEEFKAIFNDWAVNVFNKTVSKSGAGRKGESPDQTYMRTRLPVRRADPEVLRLYFMKSTNPFKIGRNGVTFKGMEYYPKDCILRKGQSVYIRYRDEDMSRVWVYNTKDEYLGEARHKEAVAAIAADPEAIAAEKRLQAEELKAVTQHESFVAAKNARPMAITEIVELYKKHNDSTPDVTPGTVTEMVTLPQAGREAVRDMKATGTDGINPFKAMLASKIEKRKGGF